MEVIADRLAARGYVALAPALYSRLGTLTTEPDGPPTPAARVLQRQTPDPQIVADLQAAITYLEGLPSVGAGKVGAVGFCAGGALGTLPRRRGAAPRGTGGVLPHRHREEAEPHRPVLVWDVIERVQSPVCVLFGDQDHPTVEKYRDRLRNLLAEHRKEYEFHLYSGAGHGFDHEGSESYHDATAAVAWATAHAFFQRHLADPSAPPAVGQSAGYRERRPVSLYLVDCGWPKPEEAA